MKRVVAFGCAAILLISMTVVNSEEPQKSIHFLGLDWLITDKEFETALKDKGLVFDIDSRYSKDDYWFAFPGMRGLYTAPLPKFDHIERTYEPKEVNGSRYKQYICKVAGYDVDSITATYLPSYDKKTLNIDEPNRLVRAGYTINDWDLPNNISFLDAYYDLCDKLTRLYGEPRVLVEQPSKRSDIVHREHVWICDDGTGLALTLYYLRTAFDHYFIKIEYGLADDSTYVNGILEIQEMQRQNIIDSNSNNMDGL